MWGHDPILLVPLKEEPPESFLSLSTMWRHDNMAIAYKPGRENSPETELSAPWSWAYHSPERWEKKKNSVVYTTQSIVFCYRRLNRQRQRWAWIWETLFTQYKLFDFVPEGVFQNWERGVREIPKKSTVIIRSWGERKRSERRDTGMSAFEW